MRHPTIQLYMQNIASTSSYQPQSDDTNASTRSSCPSQNIRSSALSSQPTYNSNCQSFIEQSRNKSLPPCHLLALLLLLIAQLPTKTLAEGTARCYFFGPGTTIAGSDYRRDYGIERKACAETCKFDACCLAFEWSKTDGICTLKSRSLNGTVEPAADDTYFGLCLDYDDAERDRVWDHELQGPSIASVAQISRDKCSAMCATTMPSTIAAGGRPISKARKRGSDHPIHGSGAQASGGSPVIYSWKTENEKDVDAMLGTCQCITVLHGVRLSFGSFSGFLV